MTIDELVALIGSDEMAKRGEALRHVYQRGVDGAGDLVAVLRHPEANLVARSWAMLALTAFREPAVVGVAHDVLVEALSDPSPTIRRHAIETLMALGDAAARDAIARLLTDDTLDPSAWGEDNCTVALMARAAIDLFDRPR
ncbi:MAG TPA: HEAT repeat domain-containing protein [Polyangia bacterium]|nr:HEAT repeat domain-containing protein [Polyangia bacterium]